MENNQNQTNVNTSPAYNGPQKICKHCKKAIPKPAKVCPFCGKKQGSTAVLVGNVLLIIILVVLIVNIVSPSDSDKKNNDDNVQQTSQQQGEAQTPDEDTQKEEPTFDYEFANVVDLIQEYKDNEVAADEKYKGKTVKISGYVKDIGKDILDNAYITINDGTEITWDYAQCYFKNKDEVAKVANLKKGDSVTLIGTVGSYNLSLAVKKCVFVEAPATADDTTAE